VDLSAVMSRCGRAAFLITHDTLVPARNPISPTVRDNRPFRAPKGVAQALALVLADGHGSSGGGGIGALLLILLIV
jgi:hypothetical protein